MLLTVAAGAGKYMSWAASSRPMIPMFISKKYRHIRPFAQIGPVFALELRLVIFRRML
jgi:hypothetical protein